MLHNHIDEPRCRSEELVKHYLEQRPDIHFIHHGLQCDVERCERLFEVVRLLAEHMTVELIQRIQDKVNERPRLLGVRSFTCEFSCFVVEVDVSPEAINEGGHIERTICVCIHLGERPECKTPGHICASERDVPIFRA